MFLVASPPEFVTFFPGVFGQPTSDSITDETLSVMRRVFVKRSAGCCRSGRFLVVVSTKKGLFAWWVGVFLRVVPAISKHRVCAPFLLPLVGSDQCSQLVD